MEKKNLVILVVALLVVAVVGFTAGSGSATGQFSFARFLSLEPAEKVGNLDLGDEGSSSSSGSGGGAETRPESNCKIISPISSDYQWLWDDSYSAREICEKEEMRCAGIMQKRTEHFIDENHKTQAETVTTDFLSSHYCNEIIGGPLGIGSSDDREYTEYSATRYSEPKAGLAYISENNLAVLCC